jgi:peptidyl-prolyl cis-trans isomerase C
LLAQAAERDGLHMTDQIAGELASQRAGLLAQAAVRARLEADPITEERIEQEYQRFLEEDLGEELHASHILVADEARARELIAELDGGADFAELAQANSTDGSAAGGGDLGWFDKGMMVAPFGDAAAALEIGQYTAEPVATRFGFHVILLEDRRQATAPPLEEVREDIVGYLQAQAIETWVNELREAATIELNDAPFGTD